MSISFFHKSTVLFSLMPSHSHFQGNRILAVQHGRLVVKFDVYLHRKSVTNFWCCLFSYPASTLLCPTHSHVFPVSADFFPPCFPFQLLTLSSHPVLSPAVIRCLPVSPPASLILTERYFVPPSLCSLRGVYFSPVVHQYPRPVAGVLPYRHPDPCQKAEVGK